MRSVLAVIASLLIGGDAYAQTAIMLPPMQGDAKVETVQTRNITGSCGSTVVRVMGVTQVTGNFYATELDAGRVIVRDAHRDVVLESGRGLSDHNGVACVSGKAGAKVLVWSQCGGSACREGWDFVVIDTGKVAIVSPRDPKGAPRCDATCASKLVGSRLPFDLNK